MQGFLRKDRSDLHPSTLFIDERKVELPPIQISNPREAGPRSENFGQLN